MKNKLEFVISISTFFSGWGEAVDARKAAAGERKYTTAAMDKSVAKNVELLYV
jgi:hypothetical protein